MRKAQQMHTSAMQLVDQALDARRRADEESAGALFRQALELERAAAHLTRKQPSRGILFRSAANLAIECAEYDEAEQLACLGLIGRPPDEIAEELRQVFDRATFSRHLRLEGITLGPSAVQLAIAGPSVGHGDAPESEIMSRVEAYRKLVRRTVNRKRGLAYTDAVHDRSEEEDYRLYMSTPRAASFAVTLRVGTRQMQSHLVFDVDPKQVVDDIFTNLTYVEAERETELRQTIPDADYRRNFVALARKLAPDGTRITTVGLTRVGEREPQVLAMRRPSTLYKAARTRKGNAPLVTLDGRLSFADSPSQREKGRIKLRNGDREYLISVPKGLLGDIVRPYFDELVVIRARKRSEHSYEFVEFVE